MNLTLPPALDAFVKNLVAQGRYADEKDLEQLHALRDALIEGELSGPPQPFDNEAFVARMRAKHAPAP